MHDSAMTRRSLLSVLMAALIVVGVAAFVVSYCSRPARPLDENIVASSHSVPTVPDTPKSPVVNDDHAVIPSETEMSIEKARLVLEQFSVDAHTIYEKPYPPHLPQLSGDVSSALKCLRQAGQDKFVATNAAIILMRYSADIQEKFGYGRMVFPGDHELLTMFVEITHAGPLGDEVITSALAKWISSHRDQFLPSELLDREIERYRTSDKSR